MKTEMHYRLLAWYDLNQRVLPWRAQKSQTPNPYYVYLSEIMLQQTTVATVKAYFERFINKWPRLEDLASASLDEILVEWQGLGYYSRARNLHTTLKQLANKPFPKTPRDLKLLSGIGDYTAAAISSIAFNYPIIPIDGNIMRVFSRVFIVSEPLPKLKNKIAEIAQEAFCEKRSGDFAQALMDLGALICRPKDPCCEICPLNIVCKAYQQQRVSEFPRLTLKKEKPIRYGTAYVLIHEGKILFEKRPEKGLLGGMVGLPTTSWDQNPSTETLLISASAEWETLPKAVKHTFTHFHLYLSIKIGTAKQSQEGFWVPLDELGTIALPTVMKKVIQKVPDSFLRLAT